MPPGKVGEKPVAETDRGDYCYDYENLKYCSQKQNISEKVEYRKRNHGCPKLLS